MRTAVLAALVAVTLAGTAAAEFGIGLNVGGCIELDNEERDGGGGNREETVSAQSIRLSPTLLFHPADRLEIAPAVGFWLQREKTETVAQDGTSDTNEDITLGFGVGCGLYFRLVGNEVFRLSLGPDLSGWFGFDTQQNNYLDMDIVLGMPINVDFVFSERVFMRMAPRGAWFGYSLEKRDNRTTDYIDFLGFDGLLEPTLALYLTF